MKQSHLLVLGQAYFIWVGHGLNPGKVFVSLGSLKFGLNFALERYLIKQIAE
jgi:hypothetical protein